MERLIRRNKLEGLPRSPDLRVRLADGMVPEGALTQDSILKLQTKRHVAIGAFNGNGENGQLASIDARVSTLGKLGRVIDEPLSDALAMQTMRQRLIEVQADIIQKKDDGHIHEDATTTATVADFFRGEGGRLRVVVGNVGNSRAYYVHGDSVIKLSGDTDQRIGERIPDLDPKVTVTPVMEGARIVVLTGDPAHIDEDDIKEALQERSLRKAKEKLLSYRATDDDLSVVIADVKKHNHIAKKAAAVAAAAALVAGAAIEGPQLLKDYGELQHAKGIISQLHNPSPSASPSPSPSSSTGGELPPSYPAPEPVNPPPILTLPELITQGENAGVIVQKKIHPGDNYWDIVEKQLGTESGEFPVWKLDLALNKDKNPDLIYPKQERLFIAEPYAGILAKVTTADIKNLPYSLQQTFAELLKPAATSQIAKEQGTQVLEQLITAYNITSAGDFEQAIKNLSTLLQLDSRVSGESTSDVVVTSAVVPAADSSAAQQNTARADEVQLVSDVHPDSVASEVPSVETVAAVTPPETVVADTPVDTFVADTASVAEPVISEVKKEKRPSRISYPAPVPVPAEATIFTKPDAQPQGTSVLIAQEQPEPSVETAFVQTAAPEKVELMSAVEEAAPQEDTTGVAEAEELFIDAEHDRAPVIAPIEQVSSQGDGTTVTTEVVQTKIEKIRFRDFFRNPIKSTRAAFTNWRLKRHAKKQQMAYALS